MVERPGILSRGQITQFLQRLFVENNQLTFSQNYGIILLESEE